MYVRAAHHLTLPERALRRAPRDRYVTYQRDLHAISSEALDEETLLEGDQYSYTDLGDAVLTSMADARMLENIDMVVYAYWTPEFDPDYSAFGPYFLERHDMKGKSFDVCDNGSLASATALHVVCRYAQNDPSLRNVLVLGMEQTTIPRSRSSGIPIPARSSACAVVLSRDEVAGSACIIASGQLSESDAFSGVNPWTMIASVLDGAGVPPANVSLLTQRVGAFHKRLRFLIDSSRDKPGINIQFLGSTPSALHTLSALALLDHNNTDSRQYLLVVDEDVESLRIAWTLFKRPSVANLPLRNVLDTGVLGSPR